MSSGRREAETLDDAINGASTSRESQPLAQTADSVRRALATDVPPADRLRAQFLSGVTARERTGFSPLRVFAPALAIAVVLFAAFAGPNALPGERLYPVREALNSVGIGRSPLAEVEDHLAEASSLVHEAEAALDSNPGKSLILAVQALERLGPARDLLPGLDGQRAAKLHTIEALEDRAVEIIAAASDLDEEAETGDDNRGPGSDDSGGDDSSGSGSDDSDVGDSPGDDSSGSGSGSDDSDGDDSGDSGGSGSDGGDSSSDDGSGSGSDGSADDNQGGDDPSSDGDPDDRAHDLGDG